MSALTIASLVVDVRGNTTPLEQAIREAPEKVRADLAKGMAAVEGAMAGSMAKAGETVRAQTSRSFKAVESEISRAMKEATRELDRELKEMVAAENRAADARLKIEREAAKQQEQLVKAQAKAEAAERKKANEIIVEAQQLRIKQLKELEKIELANMRTRMDGWEQEAKAAKAASEAEQRAAKEGARAQQMLARESEQAAAAARQRFTAFGQSLQSFGSTLSMWGVGLSAAVTAPIIAIGKRSIDSAAEFQQSMGVLRVTSGASTAQIAALSATAIKLGADVRLPATSSLDAAKAMLELSKAGLSVNDTMAATRGTLQLAAAAHMEAGEAANVVSAALSSFHLQGKEATRVADLLAAASAAARGEIPEMAVALQQASAVAHQAKQSIGDTVTALGMMANAGIVGSDAGTSLKTMFLRLIAPTKDSAAEMDRFGIKTRDANGHLKPLPSLIQEFTRALGPTATITTAVGGSIAAMNKKLEEAQKAAALAGREMRTLPLVISQQRLQYQELERKLKDVDKPARDLTQTIVDQKRKLQDLTSEMKKNVEEGLLRMGRENQTLAARMRETTLEIDQQQRRLKELQQELKEVGRTQGSGSGAYKDLQLEIVRLENSIQENKWSMEDWNKTLSDNQRQMSEGLDVEKQKREEIAGLTKSITENEAKLRDLSGAQKEMDTASLQVQMAQLTESIRQNEQKLKEAPKAFADLTAAKENARLVTRKLTDAERDAALQTIFGTDAIRAASIVLVQGAQNWDKMNAAVGRQGMSAKIAQAMNDGLKGSIDALKSSIDTLLQSNAMPFLDSLTQLVRQGLIPMSDRFQALPQASRNAILAIGGIAAAAGPLLIVVGPMVTILGGLVATLGAFAAPVGIAVAALGALGVAFATNFGGIRDKLAPVVQAFQSFTIALRESITAHLPQINAAASKAFDGIAKGIHALKPVWDFLVQQAAVVRDWFRENMPLIQQTVKTVLDFMARFWKDHGDQIMAVLRPLWEGIKALIGGAIKVILDFLKGVMQIITGDWKGAWETCKGVVVTAVTTVVSTIKNLATAIWEALKAVLSVLGDWLNRVGKAGEDIGIAIGQGIVNGIKSMAGAVWDTIKGVVGGLIDAARNALGIQSPSRVFAQMGDYSMQGYAQGVISAGGRARDSVRETMRNVVRVTIPEIHGMLASVAGGTFEINAIAGISGNRGSSGSGSMTVPSTVSSSTQNNINNQSLNVHLGGITVNGSGNGDMNYGMQQAAQNAFERVFAGGMRNR